VPAAPLAVPVASTVQPQPVAAAPGVLPPIGAVPAPAIGTGAGVGAPVVVPPASPSPLPVPLSAAAVGYPPGMGPIDPDLTVIDGRSRKPTYI
jgi:hypothetical protein